MDRLRAARVGVDVTWASRRSCRMLRRCRSSGHRPSSFMERRISRHDARCRSAGDVEGLDAIEPVDPSLELLSSSSDDTLEAYAFSSIIGRSLDSRGGASRARGLRTLRSTASIISAHACRSDTLRFEVLPPECRESAPIVLCTSVSGERAA